HVEIEVPDEESELVDDPSDDLAMLDEDDLDFDDPQSLTPEVVKAKIKLAKAEAELKALQSKNGAHSSIGELLEGIKALDDMRGHSKTKKSLAEQLREVKEINELINPPRREPAPAPQTPTDPETAALQMLARDDGFVKRLAGGLIGKLVGGNLPAETDPWADVAMKIVDTGQAAQIVQAALGGLGALIGSVTRVFAPQPAPTPQPQQTAQAPQQVASETPQALPASDQQPVQAAPEIASNDDPYVSMLTRVITNLANNAPIEEAVRTVNGFLLLNPAAGELIDEQFGQPPDVLLSAISSIPGCGDIPNLPHAKQWIENFQQRFFEEGDGDQDSPDDPANDPARAGH